MVTAAVSFNNLLGIMLAQPKFYNIISTANNLYLKKW